ncbi:MAG: nitroreductase family deazaflavin-dependent oxidoreductase, partial [Anaerolineales bacterium]|nr:nitroreductase family deazaflavin-dependent oxidoreductase [Anaerolineales bacterium]
LLLCYTGRKSGRAYATPVNYVQEGDLLRIVSFKQRTWWRNLLDRSAVVVYLRGTARQVTAEVVQSEAAVAVQLGYLVRQAPALANYLQIPFDADGSPKSAALEHAAVGRVVILLHLK